MGELLSAMKLIAGENRLNLGLPTSIIGRKNLDEKKLTEEEIDEKIDMLQRRLKDRGIAIDVRKMVEGEQKCQSTNLVKSN
jgi:hypothetical protein